MENLSTFLNQNQKLLVTGATIALVVLMSVSLAQTAVFFLETYDQADAGQIKTNSQPQARAALDTSQIRNLFGAFQAEQAVIEQDVPETSLNLEPQGVFTAEDPKGSTAIVAQRGQSGQLYGVGDRLPGNASLEAVFPSYILIKRGSRTEKLAFDDPSIGQGFARQQASNTTTGNEQAGSARGGSANAQNSINRLDGIRERIARRSETIASERNAQSQATPQDMRKAISNLQSRLAEDPATVLKELGVSSSGSGYKIGNQIPKAMLQQTGLQEGDVILSVNGQSASNVAGNQSLMNQVMQSERARVEVQRGERRFVVTVPIPKS